MYLNPKFYGETSGSNSNLIYNFMLYLYCTELKRKIIFNLNSIFLLKPLIINGLTKKIYLFNIFKQV
jgi:hypothetical protein